MKFLVLFREPDGRKDLHSEAETKKHAKNWAEWLSTHGKAGNLAGGSSLSLEGMLVIGCDAIVHNGIHRYGEEIVGGFLLLTAKNLEEATDITRSCPIYEFGGYAEVRAFMEQAGS